MGENGRCILLVVEGGKAEPRLMRRLFRAFDITDEKNVFPYEQNVYDLYHRMFEGVDDPDDLDLIGVLKEKERNPEKLELLERPYTDILLVFDYDPQDHRFSPNKLVEMVRYFDESTDQGKLYVNYPMVEAWRDATSVSDPSFLDRRVPMEMLREKRYKADVARRSGVPQLDKCDAEVFSVLMAQNVAKAGVMVGYDDEDLGVIDVYGRLTQLDIVFAENDALLQTGTVGVLCTCLWFVLDYNPALLVDPMSACQGRPACTR